MVKVVIRKKRGCEPDPEQLLQAEGQRDEPICLPSCNRERGKLMQQQQQQKRIAEGTPVQTIPKISKRTCTDEVAQALPVPKPAIQLAKDKAGFRGRNKRHILFADAGQGAMEVEVTQDHSYLVEECGGILKEVSNLVVKTPSVAKVLEPLLNMLNSHAKSLAVVKDKHDPGRGAWVTPRRTARSKQPAEEPSDSSCSTSGGDNCNRGDAANTSTPQAPGQAPTRAAPTHPASHTQHSSADWMKRALHRDRRAQYAKRSARVLRGRITDVIRALDADACEGDLSAEACTPQLGDWVKRILREVGTNSAADAVQSACFLGKGTSTVRVVFATAGAIQQAQRKIKQGLAKLCAGMPKRDALYLDEDLTRLQQAIRTARRPTYDYLRSQHRLGRLKGVLAVSMVGCTIMELRQGQDGKQRWMPYEGCWYSSALGTSPSAHEQHPFVHVGRAAQRAPQ